LTDVLAALIFHVMQDLGTLGEHFAALLDDTLADSSLADRRARLPWEVFADLMRHALRPQATRARHPEAFWRRWRLVALDGTQWSLTNTPQVGRQLHKARTRRGRAAFAKLRTAVLLELGLHNPLAAAIGRRDESEWALALRLLAQLPGHALVLADRLYGCAGFAARLHAACQRVQSHFLVRAQTVVKGRVIEQLPDGSRVLEVAVQPRHRPTPATRTLTVREIRVQVGRPGQRATTLRLWTSLLAPTAASALELARLYAQRWEHELYFREVKRQLRRTALLQSHTLETGAQEIAAIVVASALLAAERVRAANGELPVLRVSFAKLLHMIQAVWFTLEMLRGVVTDAQARKVMTHCYKQLQDHPTAERRARSCPRAVRQPIAGWPRLMKRTSVEGPFEFTLV
jgi:hypothetical protein